MGQEDSLLSEFEPENNDDGGYVEPSRMKHFINNLISINTETAKWDDLPLFKL